MGWFFLALLNAECDNPCYVSALAGVVLMGRASEPLTGSALFVLLRDPADPQAWRTFVHRYGPLIHDWCRQQHLQEADAEDVTQNVLLKLAQKLRSFTYNAHKGAFRGWLRTLTQHAWSDYLASQQRAVVGSGDSAILEQLEKVEAGEDLLKRLAEAFDLELLEEARARVQLRVTSRDWQIFEQLALANRAAPEVARELEMTVTAVLMVKSRVQKKLREEIHRLEGIEP
jgi:RNA polymerase sigma factor (sigma-70 family)